MKWFEILLLKFCVYVMCDRQAKRSPYISRHENSRLFAWSEGVRAVIAHMEDNYEQLNIDEARLNFMADNMESKLKEGKD